MKSWFQIQHFQLYQNYHQKMIEDGQQIINSTAQKREETDPEAKQNELPENTPRVYFMSLICNPKILEDPNDKKQRFSNDLWSDKQIKSIRQTTYNVQITINNSPSRKKITSLTPTNKKQLTTQSLTDTQYQKQLDTIKHHFKNNYKNFKKIMEDRKFDQEKAFQEWIRSMKGKTFVGWFMPLRDEGPKLRRLVMSKASLKLLGYEPEQFNFQFEKYTDIAVDLLNGQAYKSCFLFYLRSFQNFMQMQLNQSMTLSQCVERSRKTIVNDMKGKNQLCVKVLMNFFMPNMSSVCYEVDSIIEQNSDQDSLISDYRNSLMSKVEKTAFHSLSRITKLPRQMNPENTSKICTYEIIREPEIQYQDSKQHGSSSQYVLQDEK